MERNNRLPNVIFLSQKASEMIESQTTENVVCLENESNGIRLNSLILKIEFRYHLFFAL